MLESQSNHTPPQAEALVREFEAYNALYAHAYALSQQAPQGVRVAAFVETLRHLLEQDRMAFVLGQQKARAEASRLAVP